MIPPQTLRVLLIVWSFPRRRAHRPRAALFEGEVFHKAWIGIVFTPDTPRLSRRLRRPPVGPSPARRALLPMRALQARVLGQSGLQATAPDAARRPTGPPSLGATRSPAAAGSPAASVGGLGTTPSR